ncbi:hypothetical protein Tco_1521751, partial [Tanacetum coccineum]
LRFALSALRCVLLDYCWLRFDKKNLAQNTQGKKKATLIVIPSVSAKGTKREVFGMPIPNELITDDIRGADYYDAYLEKVAKHQRYIASEEVSDPDSPAPKPAKSTKPKITKQAKLAKETTEATPPAKRAKAGKVAKKQTLKRSQYLKDAHGAHRGPLPHVVFRETDTGKFQPLPEVEGKGKEKVAPTEPSGHDESLSLYVKLGLTESDTKSDEEMPPIVKSGDQDEGQARPDPGIQDKGQAKPNPNDVAES